jgi:hypothetical protein
MFTHKDNEQFAKRGISREAIESQLKNFVDGFPFIQLIAPATSTKGITINNEHQLNDLVALFDQESLHCTMLKFVPASGAASRMFKHLFEFKSSYDASDKALERYKGDKGFNSVYNFIENIQKFAFAKQLDACMQEHGFSLEQSIASNDFNRIISFLLDEDGLDYAALPKGLLAFHNYTEGPRLAIEEHLVEGAAYCRDSGGIVNIHFTVSPEHRSKFEALVNKTKDKYEGRFGVNYEVSFSEQKPSTDTLAVDMDNQAFREADGSLLFRPGGHGALLENLKDLDADIVFIKNIDNVVPDHLKPETIRYKKVIGGLLIQLKQKVYQFVQQLEAGTAEIEEIEAFANQQLSFTPADNYALLTTKEKSDYWHQKLNAPIRVCGMVKNEGEPGGGPFLVKNTQGEVSLQIVESSQIDMKNAQQKETLLKSTHFNPVDLVCCMKDYHGNRFDLQKFVDPSTGFISVKSKDGRDLKAQELPGLWNGAMAGWITVFVEVPIITFNPVKTVNDLLRPEHQG